MTIMNAGRIVWHRDRPHWYSWSWDDSLCYRIELQPNGGWHARASGDCEPIDFGRYRLLRDAKHAVDRHHHARILNSDDEAVKRNIGRFPLDDS